MSRGTYSVSAAVNVRRGANLAGPERISFVPQTGQEICRRRPGRREVVDIVLRPAFGPDSELAVDLLTVCFGRKPDMSKRAVQETSECANRVNSPSSNADRIAEPSQDFCSCIRRSLLVPRHVIRREVVVFCALGHCSAFLCADPTLRCSGTFSASRCAVSLGLFLRIVTLEHPRHKPDFRPTYRRPLGGGCIRGPQYYIHTVIYTG